jgi:uncharacterized protein (TIGR02448 family)
VDNRSLEFAMNKKSITCLTAVLTLLPASAALADADFWRNVLSSGATTATTYATSKDNKLIVAARDEAGAFVASDGQIRGPYLEAAMQRMRNEHPQLQADDMQLATRLLTEQ